MIQRADDRTPRGPARGWKGRPLLAPSRETLALFAVALALRVAYAWLVHGPAPVPSSDSVTYDTVAWNLARDRCTRVKGVQRARPAPASRGSLRCASLGNGHSHHARAGPGPAALLIRWVP